MFDPERDDNPGRHRFALRIAALFVVGLTAGLVLLPSLTGFEAGADRTRTCVAVIDAWHSAAVDMAADAPGQCVPESRHRLVLTGIGLGVLAVLVSGGFAVTRARRRQVQSRASSAEFATSRKVMTSST